MNILLCMDDTDNKDSMGTGKLLEIFLDKLETDYGIKSGPISRHQLYVHEDIPYTSHNSAMCTDMDIEADMLDKIIKLAQDHLLAMSAPGSDPGLCVAVREKIYDPASLIEYGLEAKKKVFDKDYAYDLADKLGVHLSEHGGTGGGIIGALAGVGLRLYGCDGRIKGKYYEDSPGKIVTVREILRETNISQIGSMTGLAIGLDEPVQVGTKVKSVWLNRQNTLLLEPLYGDVRDPARGKPVKWQTVRREKITVF